MSRKSNKADSIGNPSTIANAMYDAQKKEITSSMVLSLSFIAAGLIVAGIGIFQYFHIKGNMIDSSENIDALAWIVIAGVGLLVGIIGFVSILKSMVSLGQIGSWAKEAESHASPFQAQKLHRKVAAMNQSQSMKKSDNQAPAEGGSRQKPKFGFFRRGRDNKGKQNNEDLYYKYNPQEKQKAKPEKAVPMMEQKFDYGINEAKKLTFADEFLKKNKRDPFAQYRKELGIAEEPKQEVKQKPKFITNGVAKQNSDNAVTERISQSQHFDPPTMPLNNQNTDPLPNLQKSNENAFSQEKNEESATSEIDFSLLFSDDNNTTQPDLNVVDYSQAQSSTNTVEEAAPLQYESAAINASPYGVHKEEDNDIFFSSKAVTPPTQQTQAVQQQNPTPNRNAALDNAIPKKPAPPTVVLDLDYKNKDSSEDYNFSLFEEIDSNKAKKQKTQQVKVQQSTSLNNDVLYGGTSQETEAPNTTRNFMSNFVSNIENQESYSLPTQQPASTPPTPPVQQPQQAQQTAVQQSSVSSKVPFTQRKKNAPKTSTPPKSKNTKTKKNKKSFSEMFLNNNGKNADSNSEIVKNGTRAQRKFVDASEYDEWTCPECGKVNQEYVGVCACGSRKPRAKRQ